MRLRVGHQQSQFWPILVRLVHYYSPFWGPRAIYTICDPRGAFMCRLSTLTILPNSGPSRGLLLTVLGSQSDFHDSRSRGCVYVPVVNTHSSGQFGPVSWTITHLFGVPEVISTINKPWGVLTCRSSTLTILADSGSFHGLLLIILGSPSNFHDC